MCPTVTAVECREDYILSVVFDNGKNGLLDMTCYLSLGKRFWAEKTAG